VKTESHPFYTDTVGRLPGGSKTT